MHVFLLRGIAGSGKTSWIKKCEKDFYLEGQLWVICSADHYHMKDGVYCYDPKNTGLAHDECLRRYLEALQQNKAHTLFCDNTNTTLLELAPYYRLAEIHHAHVTIIQVMCDPIKAMHRNIHLVPPAVIWKMHQNILSERIPDRWKLEIVQPG